MTQDRGWKEDIAHGNGDYLCRCCTCGEEFRGHKRRVTCKLCAVEGSKADMTQDNLTVEKIRSGIGQEGDYSWPDDVIIFLLSNIDTLKLSLSGKTNFDEVAELKRQLKSLDGVVKQHEKRIYDLSEELRQAYEQVESQDEITAALHIVNAELGRRVESQKEEIASGKRCVNAAQGWLNDSNVPLHGRVIRATATLDNFPLPKEE